MHLLVQRGGRALDVRRGPTYAVVVDLLVNDAIRQQLSRETGVEIKSVTAAPPRGHRPTMQRPPPDDADADPEMDACCAPRGHLAWRCSSLRESDGVHGDSVERRCPAQLDGDDRA